MTIKQCERAYRKLWERVTRGDGYQPFGYDMRTLDITHPGYRIARDRLRAEWLANEGRDFNGYKATGVQQ